MFRVAVLVCIVSLSLSGWLVDEVRAPFVLDIAGYHNVGLGVEAPLECSGDDTLIREFTATGPNGRRVGGVLCCTRWKNCTIRLDSVLPKREGT